MIADNRQENSVPCWNDIPYTERFVILLMYKCNARCRHCIVSASPVRREVMDEKTARFVIDRCSEIGYRYCILSGGEILLQPKKLKSIISFGATLGLIMNIETNCFWATSLGEAKLKLDELQKVGLQSLLISTDVFHREFIPRERAIYAAKAATELGIVYRIGVILSGNTLSDSAVINDLDKAGIPYETYPLNPFGFAASLPSEILNLRKTIDIPDCDELGITFLPDGMVIACCNPGVYPSWAPLSLGRIPNDSIQQLHREMLENPVIKTIGLNGIHYLKQLLDSLEGNQVKGTRYASICEICSNVVSDPKILSKIRKLG